MRMGDMSDEMFRTLLNLWMVSDPWPLSDAEKTIFDDELLVECRNRNYQYIEDAYHDEPNDPIKTHNR